ncbi:amidohydrolase family protein [Microvirga pakistanensis]|uniref:amidohydrolase family protein n=1 Tax=Microvirga pakistanensis TaxID=1682650 RepID=UPI00141B625D|nr:amidohydrolase family protein [Microvirga pakistanensis]
MTVIDFRTYPVQVRELYEQSPGLREPVRNIFGFYCSAQPLSTLIRQLDEAGVDKAVLSTLDCTTAHGASVIPNENIARLVRTSDRLIGFGSVDPSDSNASSELRDVVRQFDLKGLNLDPALQRFSVRDEKVFPVYAAAEDLGIPVTFQMGLNWAPLARTGDARPIDIEVVADTFPTLPILIAHCGWPWVYEALALAIKYPNVHLDTAVLYGGRPESTVRTVFAEQIGLDVVESSLREKVIFASDYPRVDPKRVVRAVKMLGLRPVTEKKILGGNAASLLNWKGKP